MQFTINGVQYELTREDVEGALTSHEPGPVTTYSITVNGRDFPVKQALAAATGLSHQAFQSPRAQSILTTLGFDVAGTRTAPRKTLPGSERAFDGVAWSLAASETGYEEAPSGKLHLPACAHGVETPVRTWGLAETVDAWQRAPDVPLRSLTGPGWCSDCIALRGRTGGTSQQDSGDHPEPASSLARRREIADAARPVLNAGLHRRPSPFDGVTVTWTSDTAAALRHALETSSADGTFRERLLAQLAGQTRAVILLAAELCFLQRLPLINVRAETKRKLLQDILDVLPDRPQMPDDILDALATPGTFHGGQGFNQQIPQHIQWLARFVELWAQLPVGARLDAVDDPWAVRARTLDVEPDAAPIRLSLLALLWPSTFESIVSATDKEAIRAAFVHALPAAHRDSDATHDVDRDLLALRESFDPGGDLDVDWYSSPWRGEWRVPETSAHRRGWAMAAARPGAAIALRGHAIRPDFYASRRTIREEALRTWNGQPPITDLLAQIDASAAYHVTMQPGDQVLVRTPDGVHVGEVGGLTPDRERPVMWRDPVSPTALPHAVLDILDSNPTIAEIDFLMPTQETQPVLPTPVRLPRATPKFAERLHYEKTWLDDAIDLLEERRQVIFFGPPGTGKTFLAKALADFIAPEGAMKIVQFHPSYSYEDFFEGFRPTVDENGAATFRLAPGPVRLLAKAAAENPTVPHVLIIDEINRANIAKVFGELYLLLEYRDADVALQYSPEEDFRLPENVFVIGTMNTADRSISLVDAAIRRRFAFVELHPGEEPVRGLLDRWSSANGHDVSRGALLRQLNDRIGDLDRDFQIGPSYLMGRSARTSAGLARIWEHDILPLLDEHYYGRFTRQEVRVRFGLTALVADTAGDLDPLDDTGIPFERDDAASE